MRREDSSEAASAITLTHPVLHKAIQEASTGALLYSQSAQSSQGGETAHQNCLQHDLECHHGLSPAFLLLDLRTKAAWASVKDRMDESVASLLANKDTDTTRHKLAVSPFTR